MIIVDGTRYTHREIEIMEFEDFKMFISFCSESQIESIISFTEDEQKQLYLQSILFKL